MDTERWRRATELFASCQGREPQEWRPILEAACGDDRALLEEVMAQLAAQQEAEGFLESDAVPTHPLAESGASASEERRGNILPEGTRIGPYEVLRLIARGGMGSVYLAVRSDREFRRRVALKLLAAHPHREELLGRFRAERQILAALDHPHIARLLDGGSTAAGDPYYVMEYVEGRAIDEYCQAQGLSVSQRLRLFRQVCAAVQYAHQNLVVHRDIKPANILVTEVGVPKLLDFGIAKLLNPELTPQHLSATPLLLRPMTPEYASPEQARGEPISTASDIYSLGVLLYELLTGHLPYQFDDRSAIAMAGVISEVRPLAPSLRVLLRDDEARALSASATGRRDVPTPMVRRRRTSRLHRRLAGDLDSIVLRALSKEPAQRYGSVEQLSQDLENYLHHRPVRARRQTPAYRLRKLVRRHRLGVAASAALLLTLSVFTAALGLQKRQLTAALDRAQDQTTLAERLEQLLIDQFRAEDPFTRPGEESVAEILDHRARLLEVGLEEDPEIRAAVLQTIGRIFKNLGYLDRAERLLRTALELRRRHLGPEHPEVARSLNYLAEIRSEQGALEESEALFEEALSMRRRLLGPAHLDTAETLDDLGVLMQTLGRFERAEELAREALRIREPALGSAAIELPRNLQNLAAAHYHQGEYAAAERLYREALSRYRPILGDEHPEVAQTMNNHAALLFKMGRSEEAETLFGQALEIRRRQLGEEHPDVAEGLHNLAFVVRQSGQAERAEELARQALDLRRHFFGDDHLLVGNSLVLLAQILADRSETPAAEAAARQALAIIAGQLPAADPRVLEAKRVLGRSLIELRRFAEAEDLLLGVWRELPAAAGDEHPARRAAWEDLAELYRVWGRPDRLRELEASGSTDD